MIILSPSYDFGKINICSCKVFDNTQQMIGFLRSIKGKYDAFAFLPTAFEISSSKIERCSDEFHTDFVYPNTYNTRSKQP
jgi:hypothetical protein